MDINLLKNPNINYVEIYIGSSNNNYFCCDINKNKYDKYKERLNKYSKIECSIKKIFYKNLILENVNKISNVYELDLKKYEILGNKYISYINKKKKNMIEFPCQKEYVNKETTESVIYTIDKKIEIRFNTINNKYFITLNIATHDLNIFKLNEILKLFT